MIRLENINKTYQTSNGPFQVIDSVSLEVKEGEIYGIIGFSGAGKSTLLRCINLLERPDSGSVFISGEDLMTLAKKQLLQRRLGMGMIFQDFNLIGNRTVYENVSFPLEIAGIAKQEQKERIHKSLDIVGLGDKAQAYPAKLSGGQKQRVAIARTIAARPKLLLCDEPTSALDPQTTNGILCFLKRLNAEMGITIVIVTHEMAVVRSICNRVSVMEAGKLVETIDLSGKQITPRSKIAQFLFERDSAYTQLGAAANVS
ncbi:methionine ABC transporter ATP-binding protein [Sporomusa sp.]|uniref:methionine ABC transporter ATP-binding protein n=1 Tax=Sporomusa sp. TaxID=2078658 RepID=UPI002C436CFC|nr:methionine ABC transporter ATP-binding protein [Sporomusa sp.]HWR09339.1 methionine ABC transporter ATP-binding protein [Sporomusa sp.]